MWGRVQEIVAFSSEKRIRGSTQQSPRSLPPAQSAEEVRRVVGQIRGDELPISRSGPTRGKGRCARDSPSALAMADSSSRPHLDRGGLFAKPTTGRSSGFRIILRATPSHEQQARSGRSGVRPRLQRRDRNGFSPFSLFVEAGSSLQIDTRAGLNRTRTNSVVKLLEENQENLCHRPEGGRTGIGSRASMAPSPAAAVRGTRRRHSLVISTRSGEVWAPCGLGGDCSPIDPPSRRS